MTRRPRPPGSASAKHRRAGAERVDGVRLPRRRPAVAGVDGDDGDVEVGVDAGDAAVHGVAAAERDRDLARRAARARW